MPTYYARSSGNVNGAIWATTPSGTAASQTFAAGDVLVANSFTVTVNVSTDLGSTGEVRNDTTGGATAGGSFSLSNGVTLTANVIAGAANCVTLTGTASATIVGNVTGSATANVAGCAYTSSGTLTITGAVSGGAAGPGLSIAGTGSIAITGNVTAGSSNNSFGVVSSGGSNLQILTITGNVTAGTGQFADGVRAAGGTLVSVTVTGTVSGGTGTNAFGVNQSTNSPTTIAGTAVGGANGGVTNSGSGTLTVTRAKGGPLSTSLFGVINSTSGGVATVEEVEWGDLGASPTSGPIRLTDKSSNVAVMYRFGTTKKTLVDANASGLMPAASNVRSGTVYNGGNSTGTCAVPAASSVAFGVPVDNTTGTAALTPAAVWDYLTANANTSGSMGERLKNCSTVASVGQALSDALTPS